MPFTGQEVVDRAQWYLKIDILPADGLAIVNEALDRLGSLGLAYDEETIEAEEDRTFYDLPENTTGVIFTVDENDNLYYRWNYTPDNKIRFAEAGTYKVALRMIPERVEGLEEEIDLHILYRPALIECVRGLSKLKDDDHSVDGARLMQEFERLAVRAFNTMIRSRKPSQVRVFRHA